MVNKSVNLKTVALLIAAFAFLLVSGSVSYYYLYLIPQQQEEKIAFEKKKYDDEMAAKSAEKKELEEEEMLKEAAAEEDKENLNACLLNADIYYSKNWDANCAILAKTRREYNSTAPIVYQLPEIEEKDCLLPSAKADSVSEKRDDDKAECYRQYELGVLPATEIQYQDLISDSFSYIEFDSFDYTKNEKGYYVLTGSVSSDCDKIYVTARNTSNSIDEMPWELRTEYQPGNTSFSYNISNKFLYEKPNVAVGLNEYTATATCDGSIVTDVTEIYFSENDLE
jgi:peroxiredoxin family protein